jgi:anaerobic dimethyl sulfoxide reductase subunit A
MPDDAKTDENFKDYILGKYDGQPKTPEWASAICGTPVESIKDLAKQMSAVKPMALRARFAPGRTYYGNRWAQLFMTVGWMTGNVGHLGGELSLSAGSGSILSLGWSSGFKLPPNPICTEAGTGYLLQSGAYDPSLEYGIAYAEIWKAIVNNEYTLPGPTQEKRACDIKCLYRASICQAANQHTGVSDFVEAVRKVEFVCIADMFLSVDAQYADIVLPAASNLENDFNTDPYMNPPEFIMFGSKVIEPYFESKADAEIEYFLADKLGINEATLPRLGIKQAGFNKIAGTTLVSESDGATPLPLLTITDADLEEFGVEGKPQEGIVPIKEVMEIGAYQVKRQEDDAYVRVFHQAFVEAPEANPIGTKSGKYEIYCQTLKDYYDIACFHDIDALPKYKAAVDGFEQTEADPAYPFQLLSVHMIRNANSMFVNVKQLNEVYANDLLMNPGDAAALELKHGDWAKVSSRVGAFACPLCYAWSADHWSGQLDESQQRKWHRRERQCRLHYPWPSRIHR